jgi:replicative DNA helicase
MDYVALFFCLSQARNVQSYVQFFQDNEKYITGTLKTVIDFYLQGFADRGCFPDFMTTITATGMDTTGFSAEKLAEYYHTTDSALVVLWEKFVQEIGSIELASISNRMFEEKNLEEKKRLLSLYTQKVLSTTNDLDSLMVKDVDIDLHIERRLDSQGIYYPIAGMNDLYGPLGVGQNLVVLAAPGSFKTTFALNIAYQNSVIRDKVGIYFYLEDTKDQYQKKLISRYSMSSGQRVPKDLLLNGSNDEDTRKLVEAVAKSFAENKKGTVYYLSMAGLSNEPLVFAQQMAKIVTDYKIDYMIFDYAQRVSSFAPARVGKYEYLNLFFSTLSSLALGGFKNRPFSLVLLSQLTKEGIKRADKSAGQINISDAAEISALERDAFMLMSLWLNDELRGGNQVKYQILKSRNGVISPKAIITQIDPNYSFFGDVSELSDVYSPGALDDLGIDA